ncbi:hypothetical protein CBR_g3965 [Chara braunii]|uniref:Phospho-N-acetylmuramoyl-pentapeptide-transferase n=1 Tax=Chara braunii TaxID=69332 RepID=A0A388KGZ4_CHABU|nr:hypothetical protein CBR_g3965 [Chara braunii]|eukprot:GBG69267.1 hypothetical protein CBR_g3965 [Chara braunii]
MTSNLCSSRQIAWTYRIAAPRLGDGCSSSARRRGHTAVKEAGIVCLHDCKYDCGAHESLEDKDGGRKLGGAFICILQSHGWRRRGRRHQSVCRAMGEGGRADTKRGIAEQYVVEQQSAAEESHGRGERGEKPDEKNVRWQRGSFSEDPPEMQASDDQAAKDFAARGLASMDEALQAVASLDSRPDGVDPELQGKDDGSNLTSGDADARSGDGLALSWMLFAVLLFTVLLADWHVWSLIQRPHALLFLTTPFLLSVMATAILGAFSVPLLTQLEARQIIREEGPKGHYVKSGTPTMGGLFLVPVGVGIARLSTHFTTPEVNAVCLTTLGFAMVGLLDDCLILVRKSNKGLPGHIKLLLQVLLGVVFMVWRVDARLQTPYLAKMTVQLPWGLYDIHQWYYPLAVFCFAAMSNGVNLTDGLDGLAAGTTAAAFVGMAIACLPVYPALGVFGVAMAGACVGFLAHNHHKARVFMGDTGSLALGGALAAMAGCTGQFYPLFICSGVFFIESVSVVVQVLYFKTTKKLFGEGRRLLRMAPFHHHLELSGLSEIQVVRWAYLAGIAFAILGAWAGIASA